MHNASDHGYWQPGFSMRCIACGSTELNCCDGHGNPIEDTLPEDESDEAVAGGFPWPYFDLDEHGRLTENGEVAFPDSRFEGDARQFKSVVEAEAWLRENDIRGSVR